MHNVGLIINSNNFISYFQYHIKLLRLCAYFKMRCFSHYVGADYRTVRM